MASVAIQQDIQSLSNVAAEITTNVLRGAVADNGAAYWLLSGGTAPDNAYSILAGSYKDLLDWKQVYVAIGDERCVPIDDPQASWPKIERGFIEPIGIPTENRMQPKSDLPAEQAASEYDKLIAGIPANNNGIPHFDMVWLGMGEDGHTLSLFPGNPSLNNNESLVVDVHNAPKLPQDRISLTLKALGNTSNCLILVAGIEKGETMQKVFDGDDSYPINRAIGAIEAGGGKVTWLLDEAASSFIT